MHAHDRQRRAAEMLGDPRWATLISRDTAADGRFFYSVKTTGVYCRPSCAARLPRPENVRFHATAADAEQAGFRACKRCRPDRADNGIALNTGMPGDESIGFAIGECALGAILVAKSAVGLCAIALDDDANPLIQDLQRRFPGRQLIRDDDGLEREVARVTAFVEAPSSGLDLPLDPRGTDFQQLVWRALRDIPAGTTASYAQVAHRIGLPDAVRAVAAACAANPLAVAIPCHRVIRSDGRLSGYRWGIARKHALHEREMRA